MQRRSILGCLLILFCFVGTVQVQGAANPVVEQGAAFCQAVQQGAAAKGMTVAQFYTFLQNAIASAPSAARVQLQQTLSMTAQCLGQPSAAASTPPSARPTQASGVLSPACRQFVSVAGSQGKNLDQYVQEIQALSAYASATQKVGANQTIAIVEGCETQQAALVAAPPVHATSPAPSVTASPTQTIAPTMTASPAPTATTSPIPTATGSPFPAFSGVGTAPASIVLQQAADCQELENEAEAAGTTLAQYYIMFAEAATQDPNNPMVMSYGAVLPQIADCLGANVPALPTATATLDDCQELESEAQAQGTTLAQEYTMLAESATQDPNNPMLMPLEAMLPQIAACLGANVPALPTAAATLDDCQELESEAEAQGTTLAQEYTMLAESATQDPNNPMLMPVEGYLPQIAACLGANVPALPTAATTLDDCQELESEAQAQGSTLAQLYATLEAAATQAPNSPLSNLYGFLPQIADCLGANVPAPTPLAPSLPTQVTGNLSVACQIFMRGVPQGMTLQQYDQLMAGLPAANQTQSAPAVALIHRCEAAQSAVVAATPTAFVPPVPTTGASPTPTSTPSATLALGSHLPTQVSQSPLTLVAPLTAAPGIIPTAPAAGSQDWRLAVNGMNDALSGALNPDNGLPPCVALYSLAEDYGMSTLAQFGDYLQALYGGWPVHMGSSTWSMDLSQILTILAQCPPLGSALYQQAADAMMANVSELLLAEASTPDQFCPAIKAWGLNLIAEYNNWVGSHQVVVSDPYEWVQRVFFQQYKSVLSPGDMPQFQQLMMDIAQCSRNT